MAKSLDHLIDFLLEEIALDGDQGVTFEDVIGYVQRFYDDSQEPFLDATTPPVSTFKINHNFASKVWRWLCQEADIVIEGDTNAKEWTFDRLTAEYPSILRTIGIEEPTDGSSAAKVTEPLSHLPNELPDGPRIRVTLDRIYHAICGHGPDPTRVPASEFALLSVIARTRHEGLLQGLAGRLTGQDKRSVPKRTDSLHSKGYIVKRAVLAVRQRTSRLFLKRFVNASNDASTFTIKDLGLRIVSATKSEEFMSQDDLANILAMVDPARRHVLNDVVLQLIKRKCLKKVKAAVRPDSSADQLRVCIQIVREPTDADFAPQEHDGIDFRISVDDAISRAQRDIDSAEDGAGEGADIADLELDSDEHFQELPQWNPDRLLPNVLVDLISDAGDEGVTNIVARHNITGLTVRRPLESLLVRLSHAGLKRQPSAFRDLTLLRSSEVKNSMARYVHRTPKTFQSLVDRGLAEWSTVEGGKEFEDLIQAVAPVTNEEASLTDEFGFPRRTQPSGQLPNFQNSLEAVVKIPNTRPLTSRTHEDILADLFSDDPTAPKLTLGQARATLLSSNGKQMATTPATSFNKSRTPKPKKVASAKNGSTGRPRKFAHGLEKFWRDMFLAKMIEENPKHQQQFGTAGITKIPELLAWYDGRPPQFDDTVLLAMRKELPIPFRSEHVSQSWINDFNAYINRNSTGVFRTPAGATSVLKGRPFCILTFRSTRLSELDIGGLKKIAAVFFLTSSAAHTTRHYQSTSYAHEQIEVPSIQPTLPQVTNKNMLRKDDSLAPSGTTSEEIESTTLQKTTTKSQATPKQVQKRKRSNEDVDGDACGNNTDVTMRGPDLAARGPLRRGKRAHRSTSRQDSVSTLQQLSQRPEDPARPIRARKPTSKILDSNQIDLSINLTEVFQEPVSTGQYQPLTPPPMEDNSLPRFDTLLPTEDLVLRNYLTNQREPGTTPSSAQEDTVEPPLATLKLSGPTDHTISISPGHANSAASHGFETSQAVTRLSEDIPNGEYTYHHKSLPAIASDYYQQVAPDQPSFGVSHAAQSTCLANDQIISNESKPLKEDTENYKLLPIVDLGPYSEVVEDQPNAVDVSHHDRTCSEQPDLLENPTDPSGGQDESNVETEAQSRPNSTSLDKNVLSFDTEPVNVNHLKDDIKLSLSDDAPNVTTPVSDVADWESPSSTTSVPPFLKGKDAAEHYKQLLMELIHMCGGVIPNSPSLWKRAIKSKSIEANIDGEPSVKLLRSQMRILAARGKVKVMSFAYQRNGFNHSKAVVALPYIEVDDRQYLHMQRNIISVPFEDDFIPLELEAEISRKPSGTIRRDVLHTKQIGTPVASSKRKQQDDRVSRQENISRRSISRVSVSPPPTTSLNTGFLTLKVPKIAQIETSIDFTSHYFELESVNALRFETDANVVASQAALENGEVMQASGAALGRSGQRRVSWRPYKKVAIPKSLKAILSAKNSDIVAVDPDLEPFERDVEQVSVWEIRNQSNLQDQKSEVWSFINHLVPKKDFQNVCKWDQGFLFRRIRIIENLQDSAQLDLCESDVPDEGSWEYFHNIVSKAKSRQSKLDAAAKKRKHTLDAFTDQDDESDFAASEGEQRSSKRVNRIVSQPASRKRKAGTIHDKRRQKRTRHETRGVGMRHLSKDLAHRICLSFVIVRVLAGGLDKHIDFSLVQQLNPGETQGLLKERWKVLCSAYNTDLDSYIQDFQIKYLDALADDKVPSINFDNLPKNDWDGILQWAIKNLTSDVKDLPLELPPSRDDFLALNKVEVIESNPIRSLHNQNLAYTSITRELAWCSTVTGIESKDIPLSSGDPIRPTHLAEQAYSDFESARARSWLLAAVLTQKQDYDAEYTHQELSKLALTEIACERLITITMKKMQSDKVIARQDSPDALIDSDGSSYSGTHGWKINSKWFDRLESNRTITGPILQAAVAYKIRVLDSAFDAGLTVNLGRSPFLEDGAMLAIFNLMDMGMLRIMPGPDVPASRYGIAWEDQGYKTRSMGKEALSFSSCLEATTSYVYGDPFEAVKFSTSIPRGGVDQPDGLGLIPVWFNINRTFQRQIWNLVAGAIIGIISVRPGVSSIEVVRTLAWILSLYDTEMVLQYLLECKLIEQTCTGWETTEWWWFALGGHGVDRDAADNSQAAV